MAVKGEVAHWVHDRGFGFIKPDDGSPDVFVHVTVVSRDLRTDFLRKGAPVEIEVGVNERSGRPQVSRIRELD